jgi:predicted RNA-binding protein with PIN domain
MTTTSWGSVFIPVAERKPMHIIVDGYNLIRQSEVFRRYERISLEAGRLALLKCLSGYRKKKGHRITVVFDGWEGGSPQEERDCAGGVEIIYSRLKEKADEVIKRLLQSGSEEILVVTSDREIVQFATRRGKAAIPSPAFADKLDSSIAAGSSSNLPEGAEKTEIPEKEEEDEEDRHAAAKKKGPARRLSRQERTALSRIRKL